jgi:glycine/D-amino acid oxidase-like deaminating enzyme
VERVPVAVVGAGQAGLSVSCELTKAEVDHVVLERGRIGQSWRDRWDSFCLVTPNWTIQLPDGAYEGDDPDGFMPRDEIAGFLERYARGFGAPVREGVAVTGLDEGLVLHTSAGDLGADAIVAATGAYQRAFRPAACGTLPQGLRQLDLADYRNERELPPGPILILGSGQSGCQVAEELHDAGRDVVLSCGRAPWLPRRFGGHDLTWWLVETGFVEATVESLPDPSARLWANVLATGHGGGHDLHLRTLHALGVTLVGHFIGADGHEARFAPDLADSIAWGDERYAVIRGLADKLVAERGLESSGLGDPEPFAFASPETVDLAGFGAVIFAGGFRPDYGSWIPWPDAFDELGFPIHENGASTVVPGLYFVGVHFLRKRKSSLLIGVGEDAGIVAAQVAQRVAVAS